MEGLLATTMVVAVANSAFAGHKAGLNAQVAVADSGGGAAITGPNIGAIETFALGAFNKVNPIFFDQGTMTGLFNPTDIKYDMTNSVLVVAVGGAGTGGLAGNISFFAPNANGNTGPVQTITPVDDPELIIPDGLAFDPNTNDLWVANLQPFQCVESDPCGATSPDICGVGSIQRFRVGSTTPDLTISSAGCPDQLPQDGSAVVAPVGLFIDQTRAHLCVPGTMGAQGACLVGQTEVPFPGHAYLGLTTTRVWTIQSAIGLVTIHMPEVAAALGFETNIEPPLGGTFSTLAPGDTSTKPNYMEPGSLGRVYLTDDANGKNGHGAVKEFQTSEDNQTCLAVVAGACVEFLQPTVSASFVNQIAGPVGQKKKVDRTQLQFPAGIAVVTDDDFDDTLYVANEASWTIEEFAAGEFGNVPPAVLLRGPTNKTSKKRMIAPVGLAVPNQPPD